MLHVQPAQESFHDINHSSILRKIADVSHKILLAFQKSREKQVARILAQYQQDQLIRKP